MQIEDLERRSKDFFQWTNEKRILFAC